MFFSNISCHAINLWMPSIFGDNMVLQRGEYVKFWGKATPKSLVSVSIDNITTSVFADYNGDWLLNYKPLENNDKKPFLVKISSEQDLLLFSNVVFGDVWFASGQSNMEMKMSNVENALTEINNSNIDQIRFFNVEANISNTPLNDIQGKWEICSSKTTSQLSGVDRKSVV